MHRVLLRSPSEGPSITRTLQLGHLWIVVVSLGFCTGSPRAHLQRMMQLVNSGWSIFGMVPAAVITLATVWGSVPHQTKQGFKCIHVWPYRESIHGMVGWCVRFPLTVLQMTKSLDQYRSMWNTKMSCRCWRLHIIFLYIYIYIYVYVCIYILYILVLLIYI